jgi:hypothetical protein
MFIKKESLKVGDFVESVKDITTCAGTFTKGHKFKIIRIGKRGYDLMDENGEVALDAGWLSVQKISVKESATKGTTFDM